MSEAPEAPGVRWLELRCLVPETDPLALEAFDEACLGVTPAGFVSEGPDAPPGEVAPPPAGWTRYRLYVGESQLEAARLALAIALEPFPGATVEFSPLEDGWRDRWKAWFEPVEISPRLALTLPWRELPPVVGREVIVIEPGMAFGTGQHETTRLCLEGIDGLAAAGALPARVLDVGCGTGVLAIAAARLGAVEVLGIDNDPQAVAAARDNLAPNGVEGRVTFATTPIEAVEGRFGLVVANIMAHVLIALGEAIRARVAPGGSLHLSGVLVEQEAEVRGAYEALGLTHLQTAVDNGWVRVDLRG